MNPTVGRIVHYVARGSADGVFPSVCRAAVITQVGPRVGLATLGPIGLCVMNPTGLFFHEDVAYSEDNAPGSWHWPERVD